MEFFPQIGMSLSGINSANGANTFVTRKNLLAHELRHVSHPMLVIEPVMPIFRDFIPTTAKTKVPASRAFASKKTDSIIPFHRK